MRIRVTDGTREVDIRYDNTPHLPTVEGHPPTHPLPSLADLEGIALRLMRSMAEPEEAHPHPIGFTADTSLDSTVERSDQDQHRVDE